MIRRSSFGVLLFVVSLVVGQSAFGAVLTWDPSASGGAAVGGAGTWNSGSWWSGTSDVAWVNGNNAYLGGSVGTVTLGTPISANSVTFNAAGYTVSGNPLTVAAGGIADNAVGTTTISSNVALNTAPLFTVASGGTLALGGDLTRPAGTALMFANVGTITLNTVNGTAVGTVVANNNGILGGWATTSGGSFATYTGGNVSAYTQEYTVSAANTLANALPTSNVLAADPTNADQTITGVNTTINSLIAQRDTYVNSNGTLTLGSGGLIMSGTSSTASFSGPRAPAQAAGSRPRASATATAATT